MKEEQKATLVDFTDEEASAFAKDFQELLNKHSAYFEPIPKIIRINITDPFTLGSDILLKKKVPVPVTVIDKSDVA